MKKLTPEEAAFLEDQNDEQRHDDVPFLKLEPEELEALADCGCCLIHTAYDDPSTPKVFLCPMHEAAEEMFLAIRQIVAHWEDGDLAEAVTHADKLTKAIRKKAKER